MQSPPCAPAAFFCTILLPLTASRCEPAINTKHGRAIFYNTKRSHDVTKSSFASLYQQMPVKDRKYTLAEQHIQPMPAQA